VVAVEPLVSIERGGTQPFTLPPEPDAFDAAEPGVYTVRSTGEQVTDPEFVTRWTVALADGQGDSR
jgi:hypothetical protein